MDINRLTEVLDEVVKRLDQTQNEKNKLDHVMERLDALQSYMEGVKDKLERLDQKTDFIKSHIVETRDESSSEVKITDERKLHGEIEQVKTSITSLAGHLDTVEKSMATFVQKIKSLKTSLNDGHKTVKEDLKKSLATVVQKINSVEISLNDGHKTVKENLISLKQGQVLVITKIEQSKNGVKDNLDRSKREIFAFIEKEAEIVRDRIEGPLPSLGKYSFYFYVENFKTLVMSGKDVYSPPWHINEAKTSMAGHVLFQAEGNIKVWLNHGRHPWEVGLQPRPALRLKVKATICDVYTKILPDIVLGEKTGNMNETGIPHNSDWGWTLGVTSCDDLINKGYGQKEGYKLGAILVRYDVTVL